MLPAKSTANPISHTAFNNSRQTHHIMPASTRTHRFLYHKPNTYIYASNHWPHSLSRPHIIIVTIALIGKLGGRSYYSSNGSHHVRAENGKHVVLQRLGSRGRWSLAWTDRQWDVSKLIDISHMFSYANMFN